MTRFCLFRFRRARRRFRRWLGSKQKVGRLFFGLAFLFDLRGTFSAFRLLFVDLVLRGLGRRWPAATRKGNSFHGEWTSDSVNG